MLKNATMFMLVEFQDEVLFGTLARETVREFKYFESLIVHGKPHFLQTGRTQLFYRNTKGRTPFVTFHPWRPKVP